MATRKGLPFFYIFEPDVYIHQVSFLYNDGHSFFLYRFGCRTYFFVRRGVFNSTFVEIRKTKKNYRGKI